MTIMIRCALNTPMERLYTTKIMKTGSSLGIVIPRDILGACGWDRGDQLVFAVISGPTVILRQIDQNDINRLKPAREIQL